MNRFSFFSIIIVCFCVYSCSGVKVITDIEPEIDFNNYKTFSFLDWQKDIDVILNDVDKNLFHEKYKEEFAKRALVFVEKDGDVTVSLFIVVDKETSTTSYTNFYNGYGGRYAGRYYRGWGGGYSATIYSNSDYQKGTLVMDMFDNASGEQIWQGVVRKVISQKPEQREKSITEKVHLLMKENPIILVE